MAFLSELFTYIFKFIILAAIAVAGIMLGAKHKKNKLAKAESESAQTNETQTEV